jgi:cation-transporting ATPase E
MQSGSQATRSVADIVLINDSFGVLPQAFEEGQRIVNGMQDIVRLFLTRTFYVTLLILAAAMVGAPFPFMPKDNSVLAMLTVGIPTLGLAAWARSGPPSKRLLRAVRHFVFTAAFTVAIFGLAVYLIYWQATDDIEVARTALTTLTVLCGLLLVPFVEPPTPAWVGGDTLSGDRRPTILALGMLILYGLIMAFGRDFFELAALQPRDWVVLGAAAAAWGFFARFAWRTHLFERLLNFEIG